MHTCCIVCMVRWATANVPHTHTHTMAECAERENFAHESGRNDNTKSNKNKRINENINCNKTMAYFYITKSNQSERRSARAKRQAAEIGIARGRIERIKNTMRIVLSLVRFQPATCRKRVSHSRSGAASEFLRISFFFIHLKMAHIWWWSAVHCSSRTYAPM